MTRRLGLFVTMAMLGLAAVVLQARTADQVRDARVPVMTGSAIVEGVVVRDDDQRPPLRNVTVTLRRSGLEDMRTTATDEAGRYRFTNLAPGRYTLSFSKGAYVFMDYGAPRAGLPGQSIAVADGQTFVAKPVAMFHGGVIAGRVTDVNGRPVEGVSVRAAQAVKQGGALKPRGTPGASSSTRTNAHGEYRIFGLLPGAYLVSASYDVAIPPVTTPVELRWAQQGDGQPPPKSRGGKYAPVLYPGTPDPNAAVPVTLEKGEERLGIDLALRSEPVAGISGVVVGPGGEPIPRVSVSAWPSVNSTFFTTAIRTFRTGPAGEFSIPALAPGTYTVFARGGPPAPPVPIVSEAARTAGVTSANPQTWFGTVDVTLTGADVDGLTITMQPGFKVMGRVVIEGTGAPAWPLTSLRASLMESQDLPTFAPLYGAAGAGLADGTLLVDGIIPGSYRMAVTIPPTPDEPWAIKSAMLGGRDLLDEAVEIRGDTPGLVVTVSNDLARVSGQMSDGDGRPVSRLYVLLFSTNEADWWERSRRIRNVQTSDTGTFSITGLPAGEYYLCALTELDLQLRAEPEYLEQLVPASIRITLADGEKKVQDLRIGG